MWPWSWSDRDLHHYDWPFLPNEKRALVSSVAVYALLLVTPV